MEYSYIIDMPIKRAIKSLEHGIMEIIKQNPGVTLTSYNDFGDKYGICLHWGSGTIVFTLSLCEISWIEHNIKLPKRIHKNIEQILRINGVV